MKFASGRSASPTPTQPRLWRPARAPVYSRARHDSTGDGDRSLWGDAMTEAAIDLRSDTVTRPTERMRRAMLEAEVGDDCFGEDPTVARLEAMAAERMGKEAATYVPSGTMANSTALMTHVADGEGTSLVIHEARAHMFSADRDRLARALFDMEAVPTDTDWGLSRQTRFGRPSMPGRSSGHACCASRIPTITAAEAPGRQSKSGSSPEQRETPACGSTATGRGSSTPQSPSR